MLRRIPPPHNSISTLLCSVEDYLGHQAVTGTSTGVTGSP